MKNYFYNLNKKYLQTFKRKAIDRFKNEYIKTDEALLSAIFKEMTELFRHLGGRTASKMDIPHRGDYPDAEKYNKLISAIEDDVDKLYTAQVLVEDDLNALLKFNANQRATTFEDIVSTQQKIMELYIRHKKDISGEFIVENDFTSTDALSSESSHVDIDEDRGVLTLASTFTENKPIDTNNVTIYFTGKKPIPPLYPNDDALRTGSHWRIPDQPEAHFVDTTNPSINNNYRSMMIDTPDVNTGIGWVEFEAVLTELVPHVTLPIRSEYLFRNGNEITSEAFVPSINQTFPNRDIWALKEEVGRVAGLNRDPELINLDVPYSLQGIDGYVKRLTRTVIESDQEEKYKLTIPFVTDARITNEIAVSFAPIEGDIPKILWDESVIFSNVGGREVSYQIVPPSKPNEPSEDGYYVCKFYTYVVPSRLELTLTYGGDAWHPIPFQMTHYVYSINRQFDLPQQEGVDISLLLSREYDIFVDSEPNTAKERARALNVLAGIRT
jgi:hypothetical protein